jgi:hypothetical protein
MDITFSPAERRQYRSILNQARRAIDAAVSGRTSLKSRQIMLRALLKLRIFCNQGTFTAIPAKEGWEDAELDADEHLTLLEESGEAVCSACSSSVISVNQKRVPGSGILGSCSHVLCLTCSTDAGVDATDSATTYRCPLCHDQTALQHLPAESTNLNSKASAAKHSSKLECLVQDLCKYQNREIPEKRHVPANEI